MEGKNERFCNGKEDLNVVDVACGLYYVRNGVMKPIDSTSAKKKASHSRRRKKDLSVPAEVTPSSPPPRKVMSEIDHPLLSEGICLPRMGYLRGGEGTDEEGEKENIEPDDMERFFSDVLAP
jgi:hypothetical protein